MFCIVQERRRRTDQVNYWLKEWCHDQGFGYCDTGQAFERPGVWASDGVRLTRWSKSVPESKLAGLITRSLK